MASSPEAESELSPDFSTAYIESLIELLGENGARAVFNLAKLDFITAQPETEIRKIRFDEFSKLQIALEQVYGKQGSISITRKAGQITLVKLLPVEMRLDDEGRTKFTSIDELIDFLNQKSGDMKFNLTHIEGGLAIEIQLCPECWGRQSEYGICHSMLGYLEAGIARTLSTQCTSSEEQSCIAVGFPSCRFIFH